MSVTDTLRAAVSHMRGVVSGASVSVSIDGTTGYGLRTGNVERSGMAPMGDMGVDVAMVRVSSETFTTAPTRGAAIVVDSKKVFVTAVRPDVAGATLMIEYTKEQPID